MAKPSAPKAVYDHMPKAGGTFLTELIRSAVRRRNFVNVGEFQSLSEELRNSSFVIGSVRNPCDYYLSLWAYGADNGGAMMSRIPKEQKFVYNTTSPNRDSDSDILLFDKWVRMVSKPGQPGIMSVRFARSYAKMDRDVGAQAPPSALSRIDLEAVRRSLSNSSYMDRVDCWVKADDRLDEDTRKCLNTWHIKYNVSVDWDAYLKTFQHGNQLRSVHGKCTKYFTPSLESFVRKLEAPMFSDFGYETC